jgi:hypothetical protein
MMMETLRASEKSVYFNETTRRYIPEFRHLHTFRRENLTSMRSLVEWTGLILFVATETSFSRTVKNNLTLL